VKEDEREKRRERRVNGDVFNYDYGCAEEYVCIRTLNVGRRRRRRNKKKAEKWKKGKKAVFFSSSVVQNWKVLFP
jgi:hypothetical protein